MATDEPPGPAASLARTLSSKATSPRVGWFLPIINLGGTLEVNLGWKAYDKSLSFYSTASRSSTVKPPWGPIVSVDYHQTTNNRKESGMYFKFMNEGGESRNFKADVFDIMVSGVNEFTQKCQFLVVEKRAKLLSLYLTLLVKKKGFMRHRPDLHREDGLPLDNPEAEVVAANLRKHGGSLEDFISFATAAQDNALLVVEDRHEALKQLRGGSSSADKSKKRKKQDQAGAPKPKMTKAEVMADDTKAELENESGLEKSFSSCYLGKADVHLDNICLSKKIVLPISDINVKNIINSMRSRFDPSFIRLVLCPADESRFDPQQLRGNSYHVVQGCHSYLALKSLDETGELASMTGLQFKIIPCIIINTTDPALLNYGNSRANDLASKFSKKPQIQDLVYVLQSLINHYVDVPRALETIMRYAKSLAFSSEDMTALRKVGEWSAGLLEKLVLALQLFEKYQTKDATVKGNHGRLLRGEKMPMPKVLFYRLSKC